MPEVHLTFQASPILLAAAVVAAGILTWFAYRVTVPPVPRFVRIVLMSLRGAGLFIIILLIVQPLLSLLTRSLDPAVTMVLVDNSRSMTIRDRQGERKEIVRSLLTSPSLKKLGTAGALRAARFDAGMTLLGSASVDSLTFNGDATDIASAFSAVKKLAAGTNLQSIVLLTDGNPTTGANPVYDASELGVPVFVIGVGDTSVQKDVQVHSLLMNDICYVGNKVPVNARIRSSGFGGERVEVTLVQQGVVRDRNVLTLSPGSREYPVAFSFTPEQEGLQNIAVEVSPLAGELTDRNNKATVYTRVLKSQMKVLLVAGGPGPDVAFLRRALGADNNIKLTTFIERMNGQFYEGSLTPTALAQAECIVLIGYPTAGSNNSTILSILDVVTNGTPLLTLMSRTTELRKLTSFDGVLPFTVEQASANELELFVDRVDAQRTHPVFGTDISADGWAMLPPLFRHQAAFKPKADAIVIANARLQSTPLNEPMILVRQTEGRKAVSFIGYGVWRWAMVHEPAAAGIVDRLFSNTVRWLTTREDDRRVRVRPVKEVFRPQESIEFTGQVYDESYRPVDDAQITVTIRKRGDQSVIVMNPVENGQYAGSVDRLDEGEYAFSASVTRGGISIAEEKGTFTVGGISAEFIDTRMNRPLLQQVAVQTGGKYYDAADMNSLADDILALPGFKPRERTSSREIELWNAGVMLAAVVLLFGVEWFVRKRQGML